MESLRIPISLSLSLSFLCLLSRYLFCAYDKNLVPHACRDESMYTFIHVHQMFPCLSLSLLLSHFSDHLPVLVIHCKRRIIFKKRRLTCSTECNESLCVSLYEDFVALHVSLVQESSKEGVHEVIGCDCSQIPLQSAQNQQLPSLTQEREREREGRRGKRADDKRGKEEGQGSKEEREEQEKEQKANVKNET